VTTFENWCALRNAPAFPARPADIADFVSDCAPLGIAKVWPAIVEISRAHTRAGLADPTLGGWVASAINEVAKVEPPRSWPGDQKHRFRELPYDLQVFVAAREADRDKAVRRAQNDAAAPRQIEKKEKKDNGECSCTA
jgi:hypothetical protein